MTTPPADPTPTDPDAGLSDEQKAQKQLFKGWFKESFNEFLEENKPEEPPKRTKQSGGGIFDMLFGGSGGSGD